VTVKLPADVPFDPDDPQDALPDLPEGFVWGLKVTATADVVPNPHGAECAQFHPGLPCPGYPHEEQP
jgi:hypothetical protein